MAAVGDVQEGRFQSHSRRHFCITAKHMGLGIERLTSFFLSMCFRTDFAVVVAAAAAFFCRGGGGGGGGDCVKMCWAAAAAAAAAEAQGGGGRRS